MFSCSIIQHSNKVLARTKEHLHEQQIQNRKQAEKRKELEIWLKEMEKKKKNLEHQLETLLRENGSDERTGK